MNPTHKTVAILQSNYIPWKGYFDLIRSVDEFIVLDSVQYTRRDWRNRNRIKTPQGVTWLTIPVNVKGKYHQTVEETRIADPAWNHSHWATLSNHYKKAPYFGVYRHFFEDLYLNTSETALTDINLKFIRAVNSVLGISTRITTASEYTLDKGKNERLISLCKQAGATTYLSGPAARCYIDEALFEQENIRLIWMDYAGYPEYPQLFPPFDHAVTILDLIFNEGPRAITYLNRRKDLRENGRMNVITAPHLFVRTEQNENRHVLP